MSRYALYFAPTATSRWWRAGSQWLGRDAVSDVMLEQPRIAGIAAEDFSRLTANARRYGFHATLKAPFRLLNGIDSTKLLAQAQAFAKAQTPVPLGRLEVREFGDFLALGQAEPLTAVAALAQRCVEHFDTLRAPPDHAELQRRRRANLNPRHEALLQRWGYPYTEEAYRFHMTLTDSMASLDSTARKLLLAAAIDHFAGMEALHHPVIDGIAVFEEPAPGAPLTVLAHYALTGAGSGATFF
jgi:putative phosphonate metabolism protein